jgi:hypothetical protein
MTPRRTRDRAGGVLAIAVCAAACDGVKGIPGGAAGADAGPAVAGGATTTTATTHQDGAMTTLTHHIVRMRPAEGVPGPVVGVSAVASGKSPQERFHHLLPPARVPAHTPLALLWRGDQLSSLDTVVVKDAHRQGQRIDARIELRRFDGTVHGNVVTVPVVEIELGELDLGRYEVSFEVTELWFTDVDHPENVTRPSTQRTTFSFVIG